MARASVIWAIQGRSSKGYYAIDAEGFHFRFDQDIRKAVKFSTRASARAIIRREGIERHATAVERTVG